MIVVVLFIILIRHAEFLSAQAGKFGMTHHTISTIWYITFPTGAFTSTFSPFFLPMRALPSGELWEIFWSFGSASHSPTIEKTTDFPLALTVTLLPSSILALPFLVCTTARACFSISSSSLTRPSINDSSSTAAEYSLFSDKSPSAFASANRLTAFGRLLLAKSSNSFLSCSSPCGVTKIGSCVIVVFWLLARKNPHVW